MSKNKYHVNPITGVPTICRVDSQNCAYVGVEGDGRHFDTYSEAQKYAEQLFEDTCSQHPSRLVVNSKESMNKIEAERKVKEAIRHQLPNGNIYQVTKAIMNTTDQNIIMGIIEGELLERSDLTYISVALQNPNICKKFLNEVLFEYPREFTKTTRRWLVLNRSLKHEELVSIIEDENEDMVVRAIAFRNPNLCKDFVTNIIDNDIERLYNLPYSMIIYSRHSNEKTKKVFTEYEIFSDRYKQPDISHASTIAGKFNIWEHIYRKEIEEDK